MSRWPHGLALLAALGYIATATGWFTRGRRRWHPASLAFLIGLMGLLAFGYGPFSGTTDAGDLLIRSRFFILFVVQGLVQWTIAMGATTRMWWWGSLAIIVASSPLRAWLAVGAVLGLAWALSSWRPVALRRITKPVWLAAVAALLLLVTMGPAEIRQRGTDLRLLREGSPWTLLNELPDGSRVASFSNDKLQQYYGAFGLRLKLDPVAVRPDGSPFRFLHEEWRTMRPSFLDRKPRPYRPGVLLSNLRAQSITHVALVATDEDNWSAQRKELRRARHVTLLRKKRKRFLLFRLDPITQAH